MKALAPLLRDFITTNCTHVAGILTHWEIEETAWLLRPSNQPIIALGNGAVYRVWVTLHSRHAQWSGLMSTISFVHIEDDRNDLFFISGQLTIEKFCARISGFSVEKKDYIWRES